MPEVAVGRDACQHDAWLLGRLGFAPRIEHPKLDKMPPNLAAELCRVLGSSAIDVKTGSGCNTDHGLLAEVRSRGWRILLGGDAELEQTLDNIVNRNRLNSRVCSTAYGGLNHFLKLNTNRALDPVREQILAHARSNVGMGGKGARLFGRTVADGERLSLVQGANALAVSESLLANVPVALNPDFKMLAAGATLLDHGQLNNAKEALQTTLRTSEAKAALRFDDKLMKLAIRRGCLQCLIKPTPTRYGLVWHRDVARISILFDGGPVVATDGLLAPAPFAKLGGVTLAEILFQVIEGNLQAVGRRHDVPGFRGLLFEPGEAAVLWSAPRGKMTRCGISAALGWMQDTIPELHRRELLHLEGYQSVRMDALRSFRSGYASANEVRAWLENPSHGTHKMHALLRKLCGPPTVSGRGVTRFWHRSLLAANLRPLMKVDANIHAIGFLRHVIGFGKRRKT